MAVIHPQDRFHPGADARGGRRRPLHPAVGLIGGFAFIFGVATMVHIVFNTVF